MSATLSKLRISWVGRALLAYAVSALALVVLGNEKLYGALLNLF